MDTRMENYTNSFRAYAATPGGAVTELQPVMEDYGNVVKVSLPKRLFAGFRYETVLLQSEWLTARVGDAGYFFFPTNFGSGFVLTHFDEKPDTAFLSWLSAMPVCGFCENERGVFVRVEGQKGDARFAVKKEAGVYSISPRFDLQGEQPEEDISVFFYKMPNATYADMAKVYRKYQMEVNGVRPLRDRAAEREPLRRAAESMEIRVRMGWKPIPTPIRHQTEANEPPLLHALHLLAGRGKTADGAVDFDFKGGLTRVDGVVQIIRFLGAETAVTSGSHPHPFEDVPAWADAYVGYAYRHGIISGRSATRFDPAGSMDEAQFLTLLLRAVGYSDAAGEFVWNDPFPLAKRVGMTQDSAVVGAFTRADAFRICASALYATASDRELVYQRLIRADVFTAAEFEQAVASAEKVLAPQSKTQVLSTQAYLDKTTAGFLGQLVGVFTGYEFVKKNGDYAVGLPDAWFALLRGPYSGDRLPYSKHEAKLVYNEETKRYESWMDDDYSIDILNQYILRDMRETYGTFASEVITDGWVKYDVYDMGGGNRTVGAYALMKNRHYLPMFAGSAEYGNRYNYCSEPCIGNETLGMSAAGMPNKAVDLAEIFANVTGDTDNIFALQKEKFFRKGE